MFGLQDTIGNVSEISTDSFDIIAQIDTIIFNSDIDFRVTIRHQFGSVGFESTESNIIDNCSSLSDELNASLLFTVNTDCGNGEIEFKHLNTGRFFHIFEDANGEPHEALSISYRWHQFSAYPTYFFDGYTSGPAPDDDGQNTFWLEISDVSDSSSFSSNENLESWVIDTESNDSNRMNLALGLPIVKTTSDTTYTFEIGPTSGITSEQLHDDEWIFNTGSHINAASDGDSNGTLETSNSKSAAVVSGGSYENGSGAGTWFMELIEQDTGARVDIGFRCVMPILEENYLETQTGTGVGNHE